MNKEGDSLFVYTLKGVPATRKEEAAPADNCLYPHLLVTGSFADVQDMYRWLNGLAEVDCTLPQAEMLTDEITAGCTDELEKIHRTYAYVQQNIRYIAFETGWQDIGPTGLPKCCASVTATAREWHSCCAHC